MGSSEDGKSCKPEKSSSPKPEQGNIHVYPDWAAMQAYYGPRVTAPPYFNSPVAPGHASHPYMWGPPQPMMPPYGAPYPAIYAHGGVYAPPGVPIGSHAQGRVAVSPMVSEAVAVASLSVDASGKSSQNVDQGLMHKMKGFDGLAMSLRNGNTDNGEGGADQEPSQSADTEGSSDGSNAAGAGENSKKRSRETTPTDSDEKTPPRIYTITARELRGATAKVTGEAVSPRSVPEKVIGTVVSPNMPTALEIRSPGANLKTSPTNVPQLGLPNETWLQNERDLKRERRKQSNRESARRSRLRKQAEAEELTMRVQSLTAENMTLKSEINKLTESSDKLKHENAALMEKVRNDKLGKMEELSLGKIAERPQGPQPIATVNLLARVDNSSSVHMNDVEGEVYENNSSGTKLQLTDRNPRTDAMAAG